MPQSVRAKKKRTNQLTDKPIELSLDKLRQTIRQYTHADEDQCVEELIQQSTLSSAQREAISQRAAHLITQCRKNTAQRSLLDAFLQEFGLSNQEGIALMCMAEALLRIPDTATADKLINEKILSGDWQAHIGQSDSIFVNSSTRGLLLTGYIINLDAKITANPISWIKRLTHRSSEPVIRKAVMQAMRIMGGQYVLGRNIEEAIKRGRKDNSKDTTFSFDMLGEAARTHAQAKQYFNAYLNAIQTIGQHYITGNPQKNNGISVKLSALHPHYDFAHHNQVMEQLLPQLQTLAIAAKQNRLGFTIDAEESERLDISLDIFYSLANDHRLADWDGLGIVVQAYQKRAPYVIDWLTALAKQTNRSFMVRLVKGAYWDREIKFAQEQGHKDFPVYTRKNSTDLCYQHCVTRLFSAGNFLYPQFATHNAYTTALILETAQGRPFEFQRLHGMGGLLYQQLITHNESKNSISVRVYAPVGAHQDLLPYLVRRLLENGANSSFVNQFLDPSVAVNKLTQDPLSAMTKHSANDKAFNNKNIGGSKPYSLRHPLIPKPMNIYSDSSLDGNKRANSKGIDLNNPITVKELYQAMQKTNIVKYEAGPIINGALIKHAASKPVYSPFNPLKILGKSYEASNDDIDNAFAAAAEAQKSWNKCHADDRATVLDKMAALLEEQQAELIQLISNEAGRTLPDAIDEVREAVDFCRYYALKARELFSNPIALPGPTGESNALSLHGRGVFLCISPWNFPLAIFVGQIAAALAAGNSVIAKPAEQTPLIAAIAIKLFHQAGLPNNVLHLITGDGPTVGPLLIAQPQLSGVAFTGSTATAKRINRQLAERDGAILPLIAETGGQNAMIVDSSALPEQVVDDVISSAFLSAGQRCSALRVLYLQDDIADSMIQMLTGAMNALTLGNPNKLESDIGPVIDLSALQRLEAHIDAVKQGKLNSNSANASQNRQAKIIARYDENKLPDKGLFFAPSIIELDSMEQLNDEVFGPVLHIIRYKAKQLDKVLKEVNNSGYGLTLGIHTRIESMAEHIYANTAVGNTYINRNTIGAVVGTQPFGGEGLSGTGPKAGGPHYLYRFATEKTKTINTVATGGNTDLFGL